VPDREAHHRAAKTPDGALCVNSGIMRARRDLASRAVAMRVNVASHGGQGGAAWPTPTSRAISPVYGAASARPASVETKIRQASVRITFHPHVAGGTRIRRERSALVRGRGRAARRICMKALTWHGRGDIRCETVPDPRIEEPRDAIVKVTACAICGSDLHLMGGFVPMMKRGDVLGHECMGEVVEVGSEQSKLRVGDRVIVPFTICCGECRMCRMELWSACERSNPNRALQAQLLGYPGAGLFGYSHLTGGFPGGQAEYIRVPFADVAPMKVPEGFSDEQALFLTDVFPTGFMAAEACDLQPGQTVAVFGCGPVGLFAIKSCFLLGAGRVIALDEIEERLALARDIGAETIDFGEDDALDRLKELTNGQGPDAVIEAVGMESHGASNLFEKALSTAQSTFTAIERPYALNQAILACRPGGVVSVPGVFVGPAVPVNMGAVVNKGLTLKSGQTHVPRYLERLTGYIERGEVDPTFVITHRGSLDDGPDLYRTFRDKKDGCIKVVLKP
jgi:threonine dehydrogenase-like Zn-dependent dehydrogenase